jgi:hypothetical protein
MHSPWGKIYAIMKDTGYTMHEIMWKVSWINLQLMQADSPAFRSKNKSAIKNATDIEDFMSFSD